MPSYQLSTLCPVVLGEEELTAHPPLWNIPDELGWLANDSREYVAWTYPPCIYFLLRKNEITYIGSTNNLPNRIRQHLDDGRRFDRALWMPVEEERRLALEDQMIERIQPRENIRSKNNKAARGQ